MIMTKLISMGVYAYKTSRSKGSRGGSDSRSRTSMSKSDHGLHQVPSNPNNSVAETQVSSPQPQPGGKEKSSRTSANTGSSTTLQSPSLPSPSLPNEIADLLLLDDDDDDDQLMGGIWKPEYGFSQGTSFFFSEIISV